MLYQLCQREKSGQNVVKKFFNIDDNGLHGGGDVKQDEILGGIVCDGNGLKLTGGHLKSKLNNRRASSIEDENEMKGNF